MDRRTFNFIVGAAAASPVIARAGSTQDGWALRADVAESCSCEIPCPCNFGRPTKLKCEGSRLIQITEGHAGGHDLAGIGFVATFDMGNWTRIYLDDAMNDAQRAAFDSVFPLAFGGFKKLMQHMDYVPLEVVREDGRVRFSVPDSTVEIVRMKGLDGQPITINGLPSGAFHDYVQYESVEHRHASAGASFSHSGTNGFTSVMRASGAA